MLSSEASTALFEGLQVEVTAAFTSVRSSVCLVGAASTRRMLEWCSGKYEPVRSLGTATSVVPHRVRGPVAVALASVPALGAGLPVLGAAHAPCQQRATMTPVILTHGFGPRPGSRSVHASWALRTAGVRRRPVTLWELL